MQEYENRVESGRLRDDEHQRGGHTFKRSRHVTNASKVSFKVSNTFTMSSGNTMPLL